MEKIQLVYVSTVLLGIVFDGLFIRNRTELFFFLLLFCWILVVFKFKFSSKFHYKVVLLLLILGMIFSVGKSQISAGNPAEVFLKFASIFLVTGLIRESLEKKC